MALPPGYTLHSGLPSVDAYLHLRSSTGLSPKCASQATASINGTWYGCHVTYQSPTNSDNESSQPEAVAMGRIVGDGGWYFVIADMAVLTSHQRKGLGDVILKQLLKKIKEVAPVEEGFRPYINLLADAPGRRLYERNGFVYTDPHSLGMMFQWD
ncbi:putative GNAT family N-acetyltransferase [Talaromyces proteolyticus]|uniref:GNAT family N-acetyltransferase n=1 Tax=Talaromyces proteolyticus TaxID=1131652 RepID=A0AAD4L1N0_9EURO|nr:putative GNAT family N-acetyltransferase [Talaromyces proteolyticus]KAH8705494.1 putative GNAT family N-acetyltransferase [Talaromyces proteolyticus]